MRNIMTREKFFVFQLVPAYNSFTNFYATKHNGRKLNWLYQMSKGELVTHCFKSKYTLQASTFQMAVLLQFNLESEQNLSSLVESTGLKQDVLEQILQILLKQKILECDSEDNIHGDTVLRIYYSYKK